MEADTATRIVDQRAEREGVRSDMRPDHDLWASFARTGNPNDRGNAPWPRYDIRPGTTAHYLSENVPAHSTFTDTQCSAAHHCDFWEPILVP